MDPEIPLYHETSETGKDESLSWLPCRLQGQLPRPTDIMSLRIDNGERATLEYADIALSPTRYIASWLRQRGWRLPDYRRAPLDLLQHLTRTCFIASLYQTAYKGTDSVTSSAPHATHC